RAVVRRGVRAVASGRNAPRDRPDVPTTRQAGVRRLSACAARVPRLVIEAPRSVTRLLPSAARHMHPPPTVNTRHREDGCTRARFERRTSLDRRCFLQQCSSRPARTPSRGHLSSRSRWNRGGSTKPGCLRPARSRTRAGSGGSRSRRMAGLPTSRRATLMVCHLQRDGTWSTPEVAPFSGTWPDIDPFLTPDGRRLYFSSIRPIDGREKPDLDIFYVERTPRGWSEPVRLGPEVNSDLDELYPSLSADGTLYFGVGPFGPTPEADWDIYYAARRGRGFAPRQPITEINTDLPWDPSDPTADWEFNPEISVDGKMLIFTSLRPGGYGSGDLYLSHFHRGEWSEPENLGPAVNTPEDEFHPTLSRDRRTLYFARTILTSGLVPSDFYSVPTRELNGFSQR